MTWTQRPADWDAPGHLVRGDENEAVLDQIASLTGTGWTDYSASFVLGADTTPPTQGNSVYNAAYRRPSESDAVDYEFCITIGSTFSAGSGAYRIPVPVTPSSGSVIRSVGPMHILDAGTRYYCGVVKFEPATVFLRLYRDNLIGSLSHTGNGGAAWATGDTISGSIRYEPA